MQIVTICMKCQILISGIKYKKNISLSSAEHFIQHAKHYIGMLSENKLYFFSRCCKLIDLNAVLELKYIYNMYKLDITNTC